MDVLFENAYEFGMGFIADGTWKYLVMWLIGGVLIYLAIAVVLIAAVLAIPPARIRS